MKFYWRLGFPGWRLAAALGCPIKIKVEVCRDEEAAVYYACSDAIGLAVEGETLDALVAEVEAAIPQLLEIAHTHVNEPRADIRIRGNLATA